ncbi:RSP_7527 family protein [Tropicimonas marinistellae]|uniref:RSP_7527 family protein n=1 Tax=Tropicimonas marinistellae TaxID=1739787 RepID=UPI00082F7BD7|nr:hypothetical protein [Tropicimonas marinistellae]
MTKYTLELFDNAEIQEFDQFNLVEIERQAAQLRAEAIAEGAAALRRSIVSFFRADKSVKPAETAA